MKPLRIEARLLEGFVSNHPIHLDALLTGAVAMRDGLVVPPMSLAECKPIDLPLQRSDCGRYWLASVGQSSTHVAEVRHWHRRAPWVEYARLGDGKVRRVDLTAKLDKSYRVPYEVTIPDGGRIEWFAVGDAVRTRELLLLVRFLGKKRSSGKGQVAEWQVAECETWPGFPVTRDGKPLRNLPTERGAMLRIEPPYWLREGRVPCVAP